MILSSPFSQPIRFEVKPTISNALLVIAPLLLIALTVLIYTPIAWYWRLLPLLLLTLVAAYYLRLHYFQSARRSVREVNQDEDQQWSVLCGEHWHAVTLQASSFVSPWLMVLNFNGPSGRYTVLLPADSLDPDSHRRLRVRVRMAFS